MPSDTPTPAEIVGKIAARLRELHFDGTTCEPDSPNACSNCFGGPRVMTADELGRYLTAALAEHYHLLPKADGALDISTHNGAEVTPDNLRYAATHGAITASWIYDVLTGLADLIDPTEEPK